MNSIAISTIALCLVAQCALAQYGQSAYGQQQSQQHQRKLAPSAQQGYGPAPRSPVAYSRPQNSAYQQAAAPASYAAPKARYEEPYHPPMPFAWGYDINDGYGGAQFHKESGDEYGKRTGSYGYTDAYGVYRQVDYVADEHGFRATVKTNEPGTANEAPADVEWHAYEPPSNHYAGNQYQQAQPQQYQQTQAPVSNYSRQPSSQPKPAHRPSSYQPQAQYQQQQYQQQLPRPSQYQSQSQRPAYASSEPSYSASQHVAAYQPKQVVAERRSSY